MVKALSHLVAKNLLSSQSTKTSARNALTMNATHKYYSVMYASKMFPGIESGPSRGGGVARVVTRRPARNKVRSVLKVHRRAWLKDRGTH